MDKNIQRQRTKRPNLFIECNSWKWCPRGRTNGIWLIFPCTHKLGLFLPLPNRDICNEWRKILKKCQKLVHFNAMKRLCHQMYPLWNFLARLQTTKVWYGTVICASSYKVHTCILCTVTLFHCFYLKSLGISLRQLESLFEAYKTNSIKL